MKLNTLLDNNSISPSFFATGFFSTPILAPILHSQSTCIMIVGAAALHLGLNAMGLPGWQCPIRHGLGIPCPGCGLSRAMVALLHGDWHTSLTYHAFAPFFLVGIFLIMGVMVLPATHREKMIRRVGGVEQTTGIVAILLIGLVVYWVARLLFLGNTFITLIAG